jgi:hypothetical protein
MSKSVKKQKKKAKQVPGAGHRAESAMTYAMVRAISQPSGTEFSAQTIFDWLEKESIPAASLSKLVQKRMGVMFQRFQKLGLIHQSNKVVKSTRPHHDSKLIRVWIVGKQPVSGPPNVEQASSGSVSKMENENTSLTV